MTFTHGNISIRYEVKRPLRTQEKREIMTRRPAPYPFRQTLLATALLASAAHRVRDVEEVLPELACDVFISGIVPGELHRDGQHVE